MKYKLLLTVLSLLPINAFGGITKLDSKEIEKVKSKLTKFHKPTTSNDSPKPDLNKLKFGPDKNLIAKMDSFGIDRYFAFETNEDINELVKAVQQGGGWDVSWYYLEEKDNVQIMSPEEWKNSQK